MSSVHDPQSPVSSATDISTNTNSNANTIAYATTADANADATANNDRRIGFNVTLTVILVYRARGVAILREYLVWLFFFCPFFLGLN